MHALLTDSLIPATLITIAPEPASVSAESYRPALRPADLLITREALQSALAGCDSAFYSALIIRTMPNEDSKKTAQYGDCIPPFFSVEAMEYLCALMVKHLLVDMPSIDRMDDDGMLTAHHLFWGVPEGSHTVDPRAASPKTVTELIYVNNTIADGHYLLNLQLAPLVADAAPSRPLLYKVTRP